MEHSSFLLTSKQLSMLSTIIRTEFDVTQDDDYADELIDLAESLELYELCDEMTKDFKFR
jgi:hypothetical protein